MLLRMLIYLAAFTSLGLSGLLFYRIRSPYGLVLWPLKILAGSLAGCTAAGGAVASLLGLALRVPVVAVAGGAAAALSAVHLWRMARVTGGQGLAICRQEGEPAPLGPSRAPALCLRRPRPRWQRDVAFWTPAGSSPLRCDIWQPPEGMRPSGLAVVYFHSSAWHMAAKDLWTRPLFGHLAAQGHVVMDVDYRLCPEVDLYGMLADARHAIAWMKANATRYGANPRRVVAAGASAGGHLALLAAYTPGHPMLTPADLRATDTSVRAAVSFYGLADLRACYDRLDAILPASRWIQRLAADPLPALAERVVTALPGRPFAGQMCRLGHLSCHGIFANLLGGTPEQVPALYDLASPITHAGPHCPPTLLVQGEHDAAVPVAATRALYQRLRAAGVPATQVILPETDHIFDLVLPQVSPAARAAQAELDRFLAAMA